LSYLIDELGVGNVQEANPGPYVRDAGGKFAKGPDSVSAAVQTGVTYKLRSLAPDRQKLVKDAINSLPPAIQEELSGVIVERSFDDSQMGSFDHVTGTIYVNDHSKLRDDSPQEKARVGYYLETFGERHIQQTVFHEAGHALDSPIPTAAVIKAGAESTTKFLSKTKFSRDRKFTKAHAAEVEPLQSSTDPALKWVRHYQQDPAEAFAQAFAIVMMRRADILLTAPTAVHFEKLFPQTIARVEAMLAERGMLE
jgi:hypothetical protein